jgi:hypothetical protein
LTSL